MSSSKRPFKSFLATPLQQHISKKNSNLKSIAQQKARRAFGFLFNQIFALKVDNCSVRNATNLSNR